MSRRAKESDASLAFSTTTIDDVMMMSFFGYFLPLLCVFWIFFCVFWWISFCFCVRKSSIILLQCRPKQCVLLHFSRKFSLLRKKKKDKKRKERNKKKTKMLCSSRLFPFAFFFLSLSSKKKKFFPSSTDFARLSFVSRFDYTNAKRGASKNDSSARLTPAPTKRTREREKHTHTHIQREREREREREEHGQTQVESAASEKSPA